MFGVATQSRRESELASAKRQNLTDPCAKLSTCAENVGMFDVEKRTSEHKLRH